jgi:hypothetical protein
MLKSTGRPSLLLRLGRWVCTCLPQRALDPHLRDRVRPLRLGRLACWCDRTSLAGR